jgi:hypothetical protein
VSIPEVTLVNSALKEDELAAAVARFAGGD